MCGIFGYIGRKKEGSKIVFSGLKFLEYRGYDSWGMAVLRTERKLPKIIVEKQIGKIEERKKFLLPRSNFALGHTRWATHGGVSIVNAHPHLDCQAKLAIVHNGIIENYAEIKKNLIEKGHRFLSETDTEVAIHLIEENYQGLKKENFLPGKQKFSQTDKEKLGRLFLESVRISFQNFLGLNAIIVMNSETESFVAAKTGSPLVVGQGKEESFLSSDAYALLPYTRFVYFVNDGELVLITAKKIRLYEISTGKEKKFRFSFLSWEIKSAEKNHFSHFMLKEIFEQPKIVRQIAEGSGKEIELFSQLIRKAYGTYFVGCGTAAYACLAGTYLFSKIAKRHINFSVASEFGYLVDFLTPKSFVMALSQSGETIDVLEAVKKAKEKKAKIGALVNVFGSTLFRLADYRLILGAGIEKAVVSTKAFTAKLAYLLLLAFNLAKKNREGRELIQKAAQATEKIFQPENLAKIKNLASRLKEKEHIYLIGRGLSYPIVLEAALKIKEASYLHAEGFAAGELKHGVIALVEKNTPCIVFLFNDESYGENLAGALEMKARGGYIIGISYRPQEIFDYYLPFEDCGLASIIPAVVIGQLLGYFLAIERGIDPDKPRNLAKSVTVK